MANDMVNRPDPYTVGEIEVIDFIEAKRLGPERAHVIHYITQAPFKGRPMQDLKKARFYLDRLIQRLETKPENVIDPDLVGALPVAEVSSESTLTLHGKDSPLSEPGETSSHTEVDADALVDGVLHEDVDPFSDAQGVMSDEAFPGGYCGYRKEPCSGGPPGSPCVGSICGYDKETPHGLRKLRVGLRFTDRLFFFRILPKRL